MQFHHFGGMANIKCRINNSCLYEMMKMYYTNNRMLQNTCRRSIKQR